MSDKRLSLVPIGCQKCIECRKQKANQWIARLSEDIKVNTNGIFITLTFDNENYTKFYNHYKKLPIWKIDNQIVTTATRLFLERHRKKYKKSLRHWLITELGNNGTENIHLHGILWLKN